MPCHRLLRGRPVFSPHAIDKKFIAAPFLSRAFVSISSISVRIVLAHPSIAIIEKRIVVPRIHTSHDSNRQGRGNPCLAITAPPVALGASVKRVPFAWKLMFVGSPRPMVSSHLKRHSSAKVSLFVISVLVLLKTHTRTRSGQGILTKHKPCKQKRQLTSAEVPAIRLPVSPHSDKSLQIDPILNQPDQSSPLLLARRLRIESQGSEPSQPRKLPPVDRIVFRRSQRLDTPMSCVVQPRPLEITLQLLPIRSRTTRS